MPTTLDKPAGLHVFAPHDEPAGDCLLRRLLANEPWRRQIDWPAGFAGGIAHRLDHSTSGAILAADNLDELNSIRARLSEHRVTKTYLLLASRKVDWDQNTCDKPLAHDRRRRKRMIAQRGRDTPHRGKWYAAETTFERIKGRLFKAMMLTGIMHQIRVHAAFVGIPILGDHLYGGGQTPADAPCGLKFFLHHTGMVGPDGLRTEPVPDPQWVLDIR